MKEDRLKNLRTRIISRFIETSSHNQYTDIPMNNELKTNRSAESILDAVISIVLGFCVVFSILLIVLGIAVLVQRPGLGDVDAIDILVGVGVIIFAIVNLVGGLISWASIKMWINMSRNLFNINNKVEMIENDVELIRMKPLN